MGPYCQFCDFRCFVERRLPFTTDTFLMATCQRGMAHDRAKTGHDHTTAINPSAPVEFPVLTGEPCPAEAQAQGIAVQLEQQVAALAGQMRVARALLPELGGCTCHGEDEDLVFDRELCVHCRMYGLLSTEFLDPTGMDRLLDALTETAGS